MERLELTEDERRRIERNRERAEQLRLSQVVANDKSYVYMPVKRSKFIRAQLGDGGFIPEDDTPAESTLSQAFEKDEELTDDELGICSQPKSKRKKRGLTTHSSDQPSHDIVDNVPLAPDQETPVCDQCNRKFTESFLRKYFNVDVCDACREPKGIHSLVTKSTAKERYLLNDMDLDVREPKLRFILKRNPHNSNWGDMRLYLEAQVAERALLIWGNEESMEAERERRIHRAETTKLKQYSKKIKELKVQTRSSLYMKTHKTHEHTFGPETYDKDQDLYIKRCTECDYISTFEKL